MPAKTEINAVFQREFREDLRYWQTADRDVAMRIVELVAAVLRDPYSGAGKPVGLKYDLDGIWSRRITQEHRLVYRISEQRADFLQAKYHY